MKDLRKARNIIDALAMKGSAESTQILEEIGTNSPIDEIREHTARALVRQNKRDALNVVIKNTGKGINDMSTSVAMSTINELLTLENKDEAMEVLTDTVENGCTDEVKENARSVRALMSLS